MIKLSHTLFALPFAGLSTILALLHSTKSNSELIKTVLWILVCMVSARSAAMGFNRYADKEIDKLNPRTAQREIPAGKISEKSVLVFVILSSLLFIFSSFQINLLCFYLSFPALFIILFYSYSKRFTYLCHFILGLGIGIAPTGAWVAILEKVDILPFLWSMGLMFHIAGFDILYATQDIEFDRQNNLYSIPSQFGINASLWLSKLSHILSISFFIYAGYIGGLNYIYYIFLMLTGILFIIEHKLVSPKDLSKVPIAFFHINVSISIVLFLGILFDKWSALIQRFSQ